MLVEANLRWAELGTAQPKLVSKSIDGIFLSQAQVPGQKQSFCMSEIRVTLTYEHALSSAHLLFSVLHPYNLEGLTFRTG